MNELRDLARQGPIADFADESRGPFQGGEATGLSLRIDEYWLSWWQHVMIYHFSPGVPALQRASRAYFGMRYDFTKLPPDWLSRCRQRGLSRIAHPVSVVVILRDELTGSIPDDWPRFVGEHPVVYEYRPQAVLLAVAPGDAVTGQDKGTLGGYLWRPSDGAHFALSCAHVFGKKGASATHSGGAAIGSIVESHFPSPCIGKCNSRIVAGQAGVVDVAVADLSGGAGILTPVPGIGKVAALTAIQDIGQGDLVKLVGAKSGQLSGKVKECNVWKEFGFAGQRYCFGDLLVVEDVTFHYVATAFCKPGDSGAWVLSDAAGHVSWDAMLIAGDGANAYCSYAENIKLAIDPQLAIVP